MYNKLVDELKKQHRIIAKARRDNPELARQAKRNAQELERKIKMAQKS